MSDTKLYLGIEAGDASLKVAVMDSSEKRVVKTAVLNTETSPLDDVFSFETVLQDWLDENKIENLQGISVTIPAFRSIVRQIFVPPEAASNMDDYLKWYLGLITNAEPNAYVIDYKVLGGGDASLGQSVLLIAVRREWVDGLRKGFRNKALAPKALEVDVLSVLNLMDVAEKIKRPECVVKADYSGVTLMWMSKDNLLAMRAVSTLSLVDKSREEAFDFLATSVVEQIGLAHSENAAPEITQIHLCGDVAEDSLFVDMLREKNPELQVALMDSFSNLRLPMDSDDSASVLCCTGAIGAALSVMEGV